MRQWTRRRPARDWEQYWFDPEWRSAQSALSTVPQFLPRRYPARRQHPSRAGLAGGHPRRRPGGRRGHHLDPPAGRSPTVASCSTRATAGGSSTWTSSGPASGGRRGDISSAVPTSLRGSTRWPRCAGRRACSWTWWTGRTSSHKRCRRSTTSGSRCSSASTGKSTWMARWPSATSPSGAQAGWPSCRAISQVCSACAASAASCEPFIREQCRWLDYSLYHLDGVAAVRHLDALLEIEELDAIQWTPGVGEPQGGDPRWYDLYRRIRAAGKSVMPCWVEVDELAAPARRSRP